MFLKADASIPAGDPPSIKRILVVDDNRDAAETLASLLEIFGYEAQVSFDGGNALRIAEAFRPDVAVLDIGMPGMDGYELASRLREKPWALHTILVAHTGWGSGEDVRRSLSAGFDHHLTKPLDPHVLMRLIGHEDGSPIRLTVH